MREQARMRAIGTISLVLVLAALASAPAAAGAPTPLAQIGSAGSGAGQLNVPYGVAVGADGRVYVSELNNDRISVFSAAGTFIHAFGRDVALPAGGTGFEVCTTVTGCQAGAQQVTAGALSNPTSLAIDPAGRLYVAGQGNNRIDVFDTAGPTFVYSFGWDVVPPDDDSGFEVCTTATGCIADEVTDNGSAGELNLPEGLALDAAGTLHVSEASGHRISAFDTAAPSFIRAFGRDVAPPDSNPVLETCTTASTCLNGDITNTNTGFNGPRGIALDGAGNLLVADDGERIISVALSGPSFTRAFGWDVAAPNGGTALEVCPDQGVCQGGDAGGGDGQLNSPRGVAIDGAGGLNVGERLNGRISVFNPSVPSFTQAFGLDVASPDGGTTFEVCTSSCLGDESMGGAVGQLNLPRQITTDCRGAIWVGDSGNNRVQRFGEPGTALPPCPAATGGSTPTTTPTVTPTKKKKKCKRKSKKRGAAAAKKKCKKRKR